MTRLTRLLSLGLLALPLTACPPSSGNLGGIDELVTFEGVVLDPLDDDAPVAEAWIVVDTGDELISVRSGADGTFSIPALPADRPIVATVAAEDRQARTNQDLVLADVELPMEVALTWRDGERYPTDAHTVSGRIVDGPPDAWLLISGAGMAEYAYVQVQGPSTPFEFAIESTSATDLDEPYRFSALAFINETGELLGGAVAEVAWDDDMEVDLVFGGEQPIDLDVHAPAPLLDGEPVGSLDSEYMTSLCLTYLNSSWGSFLGWNEDWSPQGDGFVLEASYVPVAGHTLRAAVYLVEDLSDLDQLSYATAVFEPGETELEVQPLDAPHLDSHADFGPGVTVGWDPVEEANRRILFVRQGEQTAWWIRTDGDEVAFPRLPEGFDASLLVDGPATWHVRVSRFDEIDGQMDPDGPYDVGETLGGDVELE
jgi:hypothetical protein